MSYASNIRKTLERQGLEEWCGIDAVEHEKQMMEEYRKLNEQLRAEKKLKDDDDWS